MRSSNRLGRILASAFVVVAFLGAGHLSAYDLQAPISYWPVGNVNWEVKLVGNGSNIPIPSGGSPLQDGSTSWDAAFQKSIDALNAVIPDNVLTLSLTANSSVDPGNHDGTNNVGFMTTVYGSGWSSGVVGISISTWSGTKRTENDVLFNANKTWDAYDGNLQNNITEFKRVALHEFGHSLGLDHPDQAGQVVSAIMNSVTSNLYVLQQDDIDGILFLYGAIAPVVITAQPQDYTAPVNGTWPISVTVTGSELITYSWEVSTDGGTSWGPVGGIDTAMFSYGPLALSQNGWKVRATITNPAGSLMSNVATLTVTATAETPAITTQPVDASGDAGTSVMFTVAASGSPSPTYQWQYSSNGGANWFNVTNGVVLPAGYVYSGATTKTLSISSLAAAASGRMHRCVATNSAGSATSNGATLTVTGVAVAPTITTHPTSKSASIGDPVSFTVVASGTATLTYQWKKDNVNIGGATSATYNIASVALADAGSYTCVVTNGQGSATSNAATLTIKPSITMQPAAQSVYEGSPASFTVVATGSPTLTYQWKKDGVDIGGATSASYNIASATIGDEAIYTVVVSNASGSVTSNNAMLTVLTPPMIMTQPASKAVAASGPVSFTVEATGTGPLTYQWRKNGVNIGGATSATYTITFVQASDAGTYSVVVSDGMMNVTSSDATLTVDSTPRLINLSTLTDAGSGNSTLIMGIFIGGSGSKTLLIRGIGPELAFAPFNQNPVVTDPSLAVYSGTDPNPVAQNNDWDPALAPDFAAMGAFPLTNGSKDAALKVTLGTGSHTVHLVNNGPTGKGLLEIYDYSRDAGTRLTNLSCRVGFSPGQIVIVGTYMLNGSRPVLVRNAGPGLAFYLPQLFSPSDVLADPTLTIYSGNTEVDSNDDWDSSLNSTFNAVGAFPWETGSKDAAARVVLAPGSHSIHAAGKAGGGVAIVEFYESP